MNEIKSTLDVDALRSRKTTTPYPHVKITDLNKCVPIVITALEEGDIPVLATLNGVTKVVKSISLSAFNFQKLLRVTSIEYCKSRTEVKRIKTIKDYIDVVSLWI